MKVRRARICHIDSAVKLRIPEPQIRRLRLFEQCGLPAGFAKSGRLPLASGHVLAGGGYVFQF